VACSLPARLHIHGTSMLAETGTDHSEPQLLHRTTQKGASERQLPSCEPLLLCEPVTMAIAGGMATRRSEEYIMDARDPPAAITCAGHRLRFPTRVPLIVGSCHPTAACPQARGSPRRARGKAACASPQTTCNYYTPWPRTQLCDASAALHRWGCLSGRAVVPAHDLTDDATQEHSRPNV
jgi:hypothetical protein